MNTQSVTTSTSTQTAPVVRGTVIRRLLSRLFAVALITAGVWFAVIVGLGLAVNHAGTATYAPAPADTLIVLGSGLRRDGSPGDALWRRSAWAAQAWHDGLAPVVICTGGQAPGQWRSEASACKEVMMNRGVPEDVIYLEEYSRSTEENALHARDIMEANGWQDAVLITDSFHTLRANWIFNLREISHTPYPVPREWVRTGWYVQLLTREVIALHWQALLVTFDLPFTNFKF